MFHAWFLFSNNPLRISRDFILFTSFQPPATPPTSTYQEYIYINIYIYIYSYIYTYKILIHKRAKIVLVLRLTQIKEKLKFLGDNKKKFVDIFNNKLFLT